MNNGNQIENNKDDVREFLNELREFCKNNECFVTVKDIPKQLKLGFEAITDDKPKFFSIAFSKIRNSNVFTEQEHQIIQRYLSARIELTSAEKDYVNLFTQNNQ